MRTYQLAASAAVALGGAAAIAGQHGAFAFDPQPRWAEEQETEVVCEAMRNECAATLKDGGMDVDWSYELAFDADLRLVGVRNVKSTGCRPLDEHLLLGQRKWVRTFANKDGRELDEDIAVALAPGTPKQNVRILKQGTTSVSFGCG